MKQDQLAHGGHFGQLKEAPPDHVRGTNSVLFQSFFLIDNLRTHLYIKFCSRCNFFKYIHASYDMRLIQCKIFTSIRVALETITGQRGMMNYNILFPAVGHVDRRCCFRSVLIWKMFAHWRSHKGHYKLIGVINWLIPKDTINVCWLHSNCYVNSACIDIRFLSCINKNSFLHILSNIV